MTIKIIIIVLLALIIFNLGRGLFFLLHVNPDRDIDKLAKQICLSSLPRDNIIFMSNGEFSGLQNKVVQMLKNE